MSIRDMGIKPEDKIPVRNVLISVFDKTGLDVLVNGLRQSCPDVRFMSTGGTYNKIAEILGPDAEASLIQVSDYTEFPEMEGGLVKTIHPKIHAGILGERGNPAHAEYLRNLGKTVQFLDCIKPANQQVPDSLFNAPEGVYAVQVKEGITGVYLDMVVVNLYPFTSVIAGPDVTIEKARGNEDIGGPNMLRSAGKNFPSCAAVCDPNDYSIIVDTVAANNGCTSLMQRFSLMPKVFEHTGKYDTAIATYWKGVMEDPKAVHDFYLGGD